MIIGSHVHFTSDEQLVKSVEEAISYGANTFMFYTGAPQNTIRKNINNDLTKKAIQMMKENNIEIDNVVCHAPYIVNLATNDADKHNFSINFIKNEINRCEELKITKLVLHPGSAVHITKEEGLNNIINGLNRILKPNSNVILLLETMAGKGNECGSTLEEMKYIYDNIKCKESMGFCLDTCHLNDSGIDISKFDEYLNLFDELISIDKIGCIHINDSKNALLSHKDRHENIGCGTIGFENLINVVYNSKLKNVPKILETPYVGKNDNDKERLFPPYKYEIEMIKNKEYNPNLLNDIRNFYNKC